MPWIMGGIIDFSIYQSIDIPMERLIDVSIILVGMEPYGKRVRWAREAAKFSQGKLAEILGIKQPSLHSIETGIATGSKYTLAIARATSVRHEWLETGVGDPTSEGLLVNTAPSTPAITTDLNIQALPKDLPVLGNAACGDDGLFEINGEVLDYVRRPPRLMNVKGAYALWIDGESMKPWREHGGLVVVHPTHPIRVNDYVVVQLKPQKAADGENRRAYIKRLVKRTGTSLVLHQYHPDADMSIPLAKVLSIHRILDWDEAMGI
jgi:phage repressor protein C with HTH and peptisase S24 domain